MIILTIDTDWAPPEATRLVLEKVRALGVKCTVFFSTPSPVPPWPLLEEGCHPDLSRREPHCDSSESSDRNDPFGMASQAEDQSVDQDEGRILSAYRKTFPKASAVRTHRFYWHSDLSRNLLAHGFGHDSSLIMPFHPGLKGFKVGRLHRWPVWSSDHLHLARRLPMDRLEMPNFDREGLKIFCFHVAYLFLNAASLDDFNMISRRLEASEEAETAVAGRPGI